MTGKQPIWGEHPGTSFWSLAIHQCHPGSVEGTGATREALWVEKLVDLKRVCSDDDCLGPERGRRRGFILQIRKGPPLVKEESSCWGEVEHMFNQQDESSCDHALHYMQIQSLLIYTLTCSQLFQENFLQLRLFQDSVELGEEWEKCWDTATCSRHADRSVLSDMESGTLNPTW